MLSAQLQIWIFCHVIITIKVLNHFRKLFRKETTLIAWEVFFQPTSFHNYFSLSIKIIADESTFFLCMLGLHPTPTNTFEMSNSQNCKKTFFGDVIRVSFKGGQGGAFAPPCQHVAPPCQNIALPFDIY